MLYNSSKYYRFYTQLVKITFVNYCICSYREDNKYNKMLKQVILSY